MSDGMTEAARMSRECAEPPPPGRCLWQPQHLARVEQLLARGMERERALLLVAGEIVLELGIEGLMKDAGMAP